MEAAMSAVILPYMRVFVSCTHCDEAAECMVFNGIEDFTAAPDFAGWSQPPGKSIGVVRVINEHVSEAIDHVQSMLHSVDQVILWCENDRVYQLVCKLYEPEAIHSRTGERHGGTKH
jgi:hypothetical protein